MRNGEADIRQSKGGTDGRSTTADTTNVVWLFPPVPITQEAANNNAATEQVPYFLLCKPASRQTTSSARRRERGRFVLQILFVTCAACAFPLTKMFAPLGACFFILCVVGTVWLCQRGRSESLTRTRAYSFTAIRGPAHEEDVAEILFPYFCMGWKPFIFERTNPRNPEPVFCNPKNVKAYDLLDAAIRKLPGDQRGLYASFSFSYVDPLGAADDLD